MSQAEVARLAGTSVSTISAYENNRKSPTLRVLSGLLGATGHQLDVRPVRPASNRAADELAAMLAEAIAEYPTLYDAIPDLLDDPRYRSDYRGQWATLHAAGIEAVLVVLTSTHASTRPLKSDCPLWLRPVIDPAARRDVTAPMRREELRHVARAAADLTGTTRILVLRGRCQRVYSPPLYAGY
jgi:transcriptional regulator with XRE-family HTH domain